MRICAGKTFMSVSVFGRRTIGATQRVTATIAASLVAVSSLLLPNLADPASALEPGAIPNDSGLHIAEKGHVDSPKVFEENGELHLYTEHTGTRPIDQAIHNLGHGYTSDGAQNFIFTVPNDPGLAFLGEPGTNLFMSPQVSNLPHDPIWAGFGADANVPIEQYRDTLFSLDLISANGPGAVELFRWSPGWGEDEPGIITRMLSTEDPRYRSAELTAGSHTHNYTTFSHPGRYEITYRATARKTDGTLISSKEVTTQWQVGGNRPGAAMASVTTAPAGDKAEFSIAPATEVEGKDAAVKDKLSTLRVSAPATAEGTAEFTVNGFHLATVNLKDGTAAFHELLPADDSQYQVTVRDAAGKVSYTSAAITPVDGKATTTETGTPIAPMPHASEPFTAAEVDVAAADVTGTLKDSGNGLHTLSLKFADPNFRGFITLGQYATVSDNLPDATYDDVVAGGTATVQVPSSYLDYGGDALKIRVAPHPLMRNAHTTNVTLTESLELDKPVATEFALKLDDAAAPTTEPTPKPTAEPTSEPTASPSPKPGAPATCQDRLLIDKGHLDIALLGDTNAINVKIKDDSRIGAPGAADRDGDEIALVVGDHAKTERSDKQTGPVWDAVFAPVGEPTWVLPFDQNFTLPWPGYSTDRVAPGAFDRYELHLTNAEGPGDVALFAPDGFSGTPKVILGTRDGAPRTIDIPGPAHAHAGWSFTKPGNYELTLNYTAIRADGSKVESNPITVMFVVGNEAKAEFCKDAAPTETAEPAASTEPAAPAASPAPAEPAQPEATEAAVEPAATPVPGAPNLTADGAVAPAGSAPGSAPAADAAENSAAQTADLASTGAADITPTVALTLGMLAIGALLIWRQRSSDNAA